MMCNRLSRLKETEKDGVKPSNRLQGLKKLRIPAVLLMVLSLIELGLAGAAADTLMFQSVRLGRVGMWWGAPVAIIASILAFSCTVMATPSLLSCLAVSTIGGVIALVGAIVEGMSANRLNLIMSAGQIFNSTAAAEYITNAVAYGMPQLSGTTLPAGKKFMKEYGTPDSWGMATSSLLGCLKMAPSDPLSMHQNNDDTPAVTGLCKHIVGSVAAKECLAAIVKSNPKLGSNVCYTYSSLDGCGTAILSAANSRFQHNCGDIITSLPQLAVGSTTILTLLALLCLVQAVICGEYHYNSLERGTAAEAEESESSHLLRDAKNGHPAGSGHAELVVSV